MTRLSINQDTALSKAIRLASLSPSSHNCQPWGITYLTSQEAKQHLRSFLSTPEAAEAYLVLFLDRTRCLSSLRAHQMEMFLSCGTFLESLLLGLHAQNWEASIVWINETLTPEPFSFALPRRPQWLPLAIIGLQYTCESNFRELSQEKVKYLSERRTNRGIYSEEPLATTLLAQLQTARSLAFPQVHSLCQMMLIEQPQIIEQLGDFVKTNGTAEFTQGKVWRETYQWIHFGQRRIQQAETGLPVTHLLGEMSPLAQWLLKGLLSPSGMAILKYLGFPRLFATELGNLVKTSPLLVYFNFATEQPSVSAQLGGGAFWLDFCLKATQLGLAVHPVSVVLQHPEIYQRLQDSFAFPQGQGFFFCRIGYPQVSAPYAPKKANFWQEVLVG
jgi:hypothetical protein